MKELKHLNHYFYRYKGRLLLGVLFVIVQTVFAIVPAQIVRSAVNLVIDQLSIYPLFEGSSIDGLFRDSFFDAIIVYGGLIIVMALLRGFFLFMMRQTIIVVSRLIEYDLKNDIYTHYQSLNLGFYRQNSTGDLMARISEDVNKVRMYLGPALMYGINLFFTVVLVVGYMLTINVKLTLFSLLPLPLLSISIYFVNNIINKRSENIQKGLSRLSTNVQEVFSGIRIIKSFTREKAFNESFQAESNKYRSLNLKLAKVEALFFPLMLALIGLSTVLTVYVGGLEVMRGNITTGNIAEFIIYVNLLTWPVTSLGWVISIIQRAAASQKRINEFLHTKTTIDSKGTLKPVIEARIEFEQVDLVYPDSGIKALENVSFTIEPGQTLAIMGGTGSGKSTIANLITRLYDPTKGRVLIDGYDIRELDLTTLRSQIGYVPQDVFLFSDTIYNNINFGLEDASLEATEEAIALADLKGNIDSFPEGYNTKVGERGITLSGGQKQRASMARAFIRKPKILILDDSLSAVDTKTENTILNSLKKVMKDRTSVIISHRVSSAKLADKILVLEDGKILEQGSHDELIQLNGQYASLYTSQLVKKELVD